MNSPEPRTPTELQSLFKTGYGLALIREGTVLDTELTTRPVVGVDWTVARSSHCEESLQDHGFVVLLVSGAIDQGDGLVGRLLS
jgi:hypothetical protein